MADQKFNITIQTAAPTGPVDALERSMNDLSRTTDRLNALGTPEKTRATEFAFYDLDAQLTRTTNTSELMPGAFKKVEKGNKDMSAALLMGSQAFEDMQYGMRGVLNNIPGLVMALGGGMGLAGAISIAAVGLSQLLPLLLDTGERAADAQANADVLAKAINEIGEAAGRASDQEMTFAIDAIKASVEEVARLAGAWRETDQAAADYEISRLENQEKIRQALVEFRRLKGEEIDEIAEAAEKESAAAAARAAQAAKAIEDQAKRKQQAEDALAAAEDEVRISEDLLAKKKADLDLENKKLEALRLQRDELEKASKLTRLDDPFRVYSTPGWVTSPTPEAEAAKSQLGPVQATIAVVERRIESIEQATSKTGEITNQLAAATEKLAQARTAADDIASAVETTSAGIQESLIADDLAGQVRAMGEVAAQAAVEIKQGVAGIEANNEATRAAKAEIDAVTADGKVTLDEIGRALAALRTLVSNGSTQAAAVLSDVELISQRQRAMEVRIENLSRLNGQNTIPGNTR